MLTDPHRKRSAPRPDEFPQAIPPRSPDRQPVQIPPAATGFTGYPTAATTSRDYNQYYGAPPVKRHRTSMDYGRQSIYDQDSRMAARPMDPYSQPTTMYSQQPAYQTPGMQPYQTSQVVPDYGVRPTFSSRDHLSWFAPEGHPSN